MAGSEATQSSVDSAEHHENTGSGRHGRWTWLPYVTPILILLFAAALVVTLTRNWNAWERGRAEQSTNDAYVRGDLTPLSTKVPGIVRSVKVGDYQRVRAGELLVELEDEVYRAQVAQAIAAVEAAKAAIEKQIAAAAAGIGAVRADCSEHVSVH